MDRITLKNYRCFHDRQTARLAPLTLLVGENSTGKTSFMAMIRVLWNVAYRQRAPDFKEAPYDLGSFDELAHHRGAKGGRAEAFEAGFNVAPRVARGKRRHAGTDGQPFHFDVTFKKRGTAAIPVKMRLIHQSIWIEANLEGQSWRTSFGTPRGTWKTSDTVPLDADFNWTFFPFFYPRYSKVFEGREIGAELTPLQGSELPAAEDWELIEQLVEAHRRRGMNAYTDHCYASAPVRSKPRRTYDPSRPTPDPGGDYVPMYLASMYFRDQTQWKDLKHALEIFGKTSGLFDEISIRPLGKRDSEPFQVQVRKFGSRLKGPRRNLIDMGYGISQVLPVITELLRRDAPSIFLLQQPEVHLHPSAQAALGSLFCKVASRERQLVIETHSDHLLDRVRMDVRDGAGRLRPEDVSILYFERRDLTADVRIHSLRLDEEGNVLGAPDGYRNFFLEETVRSLWKRQPAGA